jgi:hypothetical protein
VRVDARWQRVGGASWGAIALAALAWSCGGSDPNGLLEPPVDGGQEATAPLSDATTGGVDSTLGSQPDATLAEAGDAGSTGDDAASDASSDDASGDGAWDTGATDAADGAAEDSGYDASADDAGGDGSAADAGTDASPAVCGVPDDCVVRIPIPTTTSTGTGGGFPITVTICPSGASTSTSPPQCYLDTDIGHASWTFSGSSASGTLPARLQDLPITVTVLGASQTVYAGMGAGACGDGGIPDVSFAGVPVQLLLARADGGALADAGGSVLRCDPLDVTDAGAAIPQSDIVICGCSGVFASLCASGWTYVQSAADNALAQVVTNAIDGRACLK